MGIFGGLFGKKQQLSKAAFAFVVPRLISDLELLREQFLFACVTALKSEGAPVAGISPILQRGSELDAALKGFQLTSIMGFAWNYVKFEDWVPFDKVMTAALDSNDMEITSKYRERYLDCQGNVDLVSSFLAEDIHRIWGCPEPASRFKRGLGNAAITLGTVNQAATAKVFGDSKTEIKLRSSLRP